jgi:hypothetical protein
MHSVLHGNRKSGAVFAVTVRPLETPPGVDDVTFLTGHHVVVIGR